MVAPKTYRILALSGGGVRGLVTAVWLNRLEQKLGAPIGQFFDLIAGTSAGSLTACALASGMRTEAIISLYRDRSQDIFRSHLPDCGVGGCGFLARDLMRLATMKKDWNRC